MLWKSLDLSKIFVAYSSASKQLQLRSRSVTLIKSILRDYLLCCRLSNQVCRALRVVANLKSACTTPRDNETYFGSKGMAERSTTLRFSTPRTRKSVSRHAFSSSFFPILIVLHICQDDMSVLETCSQMSSSESLFGPRNLTVLLLKTGALRYFMHVRIDSMATRLSKG